MKNISTTTLTALAIALLIALPVRAQTTMRPNPGTNASPVGAEPAMFSGLVQSADSDGVQGTVTVRGPKPEAPSSGTQGGGTSSQKMVQYVTKTFRIDRASTITVVGKPKATVSDLRNGDQVEIMFVPAPGGQPLVKALTDSGRPKKPGSTAH
jgi:hypothetical protein